MQVAMSVVMEKSSNNSIKDKNTNELQTDTIDERPAVSNENTSTECAPETIVKDSSKLEPSTATEAIGQETPEPKVKKSYADLAKSGSNEIAIRRNSVPNKPKPNIRSSLPRQNSRSDRATPPNRKSHHFVGKNCQ